MKTAWIYPGQGAQYSGMGRDFYEHFEEARQIFDMGSEILGYDLPALCFEENPKLHQTAYTQPALLAVELAITEVFRQRTGIRPDMTAGLSLGEYAALYAAGVLSAEDCLWAVAVRGRLMEEALPQGRGAMAAVLMLEPVKAEAVLAQHEMVWIANDNCPGQLVISGEREALTAACRDLQAAGAKRCVPLQVSGAFHCPLMEPAAQALEAALRSLNFQKPKLPYVSNVNAQSVTETADIVPLLKAQLYSGVRWRESVEYMLAEGVDTFYELGPGKSLSGMVKKIAAGRPVKLKNIERTEDLT